MSKTIIHYRRERIPKDVERKYLDNLSRMPREYKAHCGKPVCELLTGSLEEAYTFLLDLVTVPLNPKSEELCPVCAEHEDVAMATLAGVK